MRSDRRPIVPRNDRSSSAYRAAVVSKRSAKAAMSCARLEAESRSRAASALRHGVPLERPGAP